MHLCVLFFAILFSVGQAQTVIFKALTEDHFTTVNTSIFSFYNYSSESAALYPSLNLAPMNKKDPATTPVIHQCATKSILGGPLIYGPGENISVIGLNMPLNSYPSHYRYNFEMIIYIFDSAMLTAINMLPNPVTSGFYLVYGPDPNFNTTDTCGSTSTSIVRMGYTKLGRMPTINYFITVQNNTLPYVLGYYGFREIYLYLYLCSPLCSACTQYLCSLCVPNAAKINNTNCACKTGFYEVFCPDETPCNHQCLTCPMYCATCDSATNCFTCNDGYYLTPNGQCVSSCPLNTYLSGTSCLSCDGSCRSCRAGTKWNCLTCPSDFLLYKGECLGLCPNQTYQTTTSVNGYTQPICLDCDSTCSACTGPYSTQCIGCSIASLLLYDSTCVQFCPTGTYNYLQEKQCFECFAGCLSCFGPNEDQCMTCTGTKTIINDNTCVSQCPSNKFPVFYPSSESVVCESCGLFCSVCGGENVCSKCQNGFYYDQISQSCMISTSISAYVVEASNPTKFYLIFNKYWNYIQENYNDIVSVAILNNRNIAFDYEIMSSSAYKNAFFIFLYYNETLPSGQTLTLSINIDYNLTDFQYKLQPNSSYITIPLNGYPFCNENQFFNRTINQTRNKIIIKPKLIATSNPIQFQLNFNKINNINTLVSEYSQVTISGFLSSEFNYSITPTSSYGSFTLNLTPYKTVVLLPTMKYSLEMPQEIIILNELSDQIPMASIELKDYVNLTSNEKNSIDSIKRQNEAASYAAGGSSCFGTIFSSSPLFIQGMMLSQLIFLMKYTKIEFPPNLNGLFTEQNLPVLVFFYEFPTEEDDESVLPPEFITDEVSPYFLNNCGEIIGKNAVLILIAAIFVIFTENLKNSENIFVRSFKAIRNVLVWEAVLFFNLENILKIFFFSTVSLMYPGLSSPQSQLNYAIAIVFLVIASLFLLHIFFLIKNCQNLKVLEQKEKHKLSIFMKDSPKHNSAKLSTAFDRKTRIFDEAMFSRKELKLARSTEFNFTLDLKKTGTQFDKDSKETTDLPSLTPLTPNYSSPFSPLASPPKLYNNGENLKSPTFKSKNQVSFVRFNPNGDSSPEEIILQREKSKNEEEKLKSFKSFGDSSPRPEKFRKTVEMTETEIRPPRLILQKKSTQLYEEKKPLETKCIQLQPLKFLYLPDPKNPEQYLKDHTFLHEEIKIHKYLGYFVFFDYLRQVLICILIGVMRSQPLPQMALINFINLTFITLTLIYRPFVKTLSLICGLINELITGSALIGGLALAIMDSLKNDDMDTRMNLGWVIIYANLALLYWIIFSVLMTACIKICEKMRLRKKVFTEWET